MRISVIGPGASGRLELRVLTSRSPWRISVRGQNDEALLDPQSAGFLAEGYPDWLRELCSAIDADRVLAEAIVAEVERRR